MEDDSVISELKQMFPEIANQQVLYLQLFYQPLSLQNDSIGIPDANPFSALLLLDSSGGNIPRA